MANVCPAPIHVCAVRVTLLDTDTGEPDDPPDNVFVSDKATSVQVTPNVATGADVEQRGGCDCIIATYQGPDLLKGYNLEFAKGALEPALEVMLLGGTPITSGADTIGVFAPGPLGCGDRAPVVGFEFWGDAYVGSAPDGTFPYFHFLFPRTSWQEGQQSFANEFANPAFTGKGTANPNWGSGPHGDQPLAIPTDSPGGYWLDDAIPTASCDPTDVTPGT